MPSRSVGPASFPRGLILSGSVVPFVPRIPSESARPQGEPLPELWRRWWSIAAPNRLRSPNSVKNYKRAEALSRSLPPHPSPGDVVVWLAAMLSAGNGPGTVENRRACLAAVYTYAQQAGWATSHPVALAPWKRPAPPDKLAWRGDDLVRRFDLAQRACVSPTERAFLGLLRFAALRCEEALGLERGDVVTRSDPWRVCIVRQRGRPNSMDTKTVKGRRERGRRRIPAPRPLVELLSPVLAAPPVQLTFGTRGMPRRPQVVPFVIPFRQHDLNKLRERIAGAFGDLPAGEAWHVWRRSRLLELWDAGVPLKDVSQLAGHESETTTERYIGRHAGADVRADLFETVDVPAQPEGGAPCPF